MKWSQTANQLVASAYLDAGAISLGQSPSAEELALGLNKLNGILSELEIYGNAWPLVSAGQSSLAWSALTPSFVTAPENYAANMIIWHTKDGVDVRLTPIMESAYNAIANKADTAEVPSVFFEDADKKIYLYPVPTTDPLLKCKFVTYIDETTGAAIAVPPSWILPLQIGLCYELCLPLGRHDLRRQIEPDWMMRRQKMMGYAVEAAFPTFTVDDGASAYKSFVPQASNFITYIPLIVSI